MGNGSRMGILFFSPFAKTEISLALVQFNFKSFGSNYLYQSLGYVLEFKFMSSLSWVLDLVNSFPPCWNQNFPHPSLELLVKFYVLK